MHCDRLLSYFITRLLIAVAVFYGVWRLGDAVWNLAAGPTPSPIVDRAIATLAALVTMLIVGGLIERRSAAGLGFPTRSAFRDMTFGFILGAGLLTAIVGVMALCGWYQVNGLRWQDPAGGALALAVFGLISYFLVAVLEEVLFRGMLLRRLEKELGTWIGLALSALVFGGAHLLNENASLWSAVGIALESGILFGAAYVFTRALWMPIGLHWAWNYFEGTSLGRQCQAHSSRGYLWPQPADRTCGRAAPSVRKRASSR